MKKRKLIILGAFLILFICMFTVASYAADSDEFTSGPLNYCILDDGTVKITKYNGTYEKYTVPSKIDGKSVSVIGRYAFVNDYTLKTLVIPGSVKELENQAIHGCYSVKTITIKSGKLEYISNTGIESCTALITLNVPANVKHIGTLNDCRALEKIVIDENNKYLCSVDGVVFSKDKKTLIKFPQGKIEEMYIVPSTVKNIGEWSFYEAKLPKIFVPKTVEEIAESAFAYSEAEIYTDASKAPSKWKEGVYGRKVYYNQKIESGVSLGVAKKLTATQTTSTVTLSWSKVKNATGYRVYQKVNGKWKKLCDTSKNTYKVASLKSGTEYSFAVKAYSKSNGKTYWASNYTSIKTATAPATPKSVSASQSTGSITLSWSKVTGATGYRVYLYNAKTKKYEKIKTTASRSYKVADLKAGNDYKFKVKAYKKVDGNNIWGTATPVFATATKCKTPTIKVSSTKKGIANLSWTNVSGESGYQLYMSTNKDSGFKKLVNYKANATKDTKSKLTSGKTYYFKVRAYKKTDSGTVYSSYSPVKGVKVK